MKQMAGIILAVAVSVHTVVAWDFAMAVAPMWHSSIFGPYFVVGAIFSGIAALLLAMAIIRRVLHLEAFLRPLHFDNLGKLLFLMSLLWLYFTVAENLTAWYGNDPAEMNVFTERIRGRFAPYFGVMVFCNFVVPLVLLGIRRLRSVRTVTITAVSVLIGMWLERYLIILPTLSRPRLAAATGFYSPTWVEISITASTFAAIVFLYLIFCKLFPIIAIWEYKDVVERGV
jgi:molybdopterin-containing oxidoreductase family membrane subunit